MEFSAEQKRIDILRDGLEEIQEHRRESESKQGSIVGLMRDDEQERVSES